MSDLEQRVARLEQLVEQLMKRKPEPKGRAHRLPDDWYPTPEEVAWAKESHPNVNVTLETQRFIDHWHSTGEAKVSWSATYRNWIRRAADFASPRPARPAFGPASRTATVNEANRERVNGALDKLAALRRTSS